MTFSGLYSRYNTGEAEVCSFRLLKKAYIGQRVRMTGDKNTVKFENLPMKNMLIESCYKEGFRISHPNLPKKIWVDFHQLPLTKLTITNGVISDEITFVENVINHEMELIKTDEKVYKELVAFTNEKAESDKVFKLSDLKPGDVVQRALCKEGNHIIYLGTFFSVPFERKTKWGYGYSSERSNFYWIDKKVLPKRAYFLKVSSDILSASELKEINDKYRKLGEYDYNNKSYAERESLWKAKQLEIDLAKKEIKERVGTRYMIINFAYTSKMIKEFYRFDNEFKEEYSDLDKNMAMINEVPAKRYMIDIAKPFTIPDFLSGHGNPGDYYVYVDKTKKDIHKKAEERWNEMTDVKLATPEVVKETFGIEIE